MRKCKNCESEYGFSLCATDAHYNKATDLMDGVRSRRTNSNGACTDYRRKRWKFWRPK